MYFHRESRPVELLAERQDHVVDGDHRHAAIHENIAEQAAGQVLGTSDQAKFCTLKDLCVVEGQLLVQTAPESHRIVIATLVGKQQNPYRLIGLKLFEDGLLLFVGQVELGDQQGPFSGFLQNVVHEGSVLMLKLFGQWTESWNGEIEPLSETERVEAATGNHRLAEIQTQQMLLVRYEIEEQMVFTGSFIEIPQTADGLRDLAGVRKGQIV